jgi:ankyrin repeat protein
MTQNKRSREVATSMVLRSYEEKKKKKPQLNLIDSLCEDVLVYIMDFLEARELRDLWCCSKYLYSLSSHTLVKRQLSLLPAGLLAIQPMMVVITDQQLHVLKTLRLKKESLEDWFQSACRNGHLEVVKYLVSLGVDIHVWEEYGFRWACMNGHLEVVKYLVSLGVNIHTMEEWGFRLACQNGHLEVVKYLVSLGVDIHAMEEWGFRSACENGHLEVVKYLVSLGVDIHADDEAGFRWACKNGHLEVVKYIVPLGVDIHVWEERGFRWAQMNGHLEVVNFLKSLKNKQ